jgi:sporulation protein YlmC with PRC-barrel domain
VNRSVKHLQGDELRGFDGELGRVQRLYFDPQKWTIRYLAVGTAPGSALVSTLSLRAVDCRNRTIRAGLRRAQVLGAPRVNPAEPVDGETELRCHQHYGLPPYWGGLGVWGDYMLPALLLAQWGDGEAAGLPQDPPAHEEPLHGTDELENLRVRASDGELGGVEDLVVDDESWQIAFLVVDTGGRLQGRKVIVDPAWIDSVDWPLRTAQIDLPRGAIEGAAQI